MKILLTVHQFLPEYFSGTEVLAFGVAKELQKRGHEVVVFTGFPAKQVLSDVERFDQYTVDGILVHRFHHAYVRAAGQTSIAEVEYNNVLAARYFAQLLHEIRPDIVHFFHLSRLGSGLIDAAEAAEVPCFYTPTDFWAICPTSQLLLNNGRVCQGPSALGGNCVKHVAGLTQGSKIAAAVRFLPDLVADAVVLAARAGLVPKRLPSAEVVAMSRRRQFNVERLNALQGIVSPTRFMTDVLVRSGVSAELVTQSAYGIDLGDFESASPRARSDRPLTVGFVGTLAGHKGCHVLIEAFKRLREGSACLRIYGRATDFPDYFTQLERAAAGVPGIEFCGTFPNSEIARVLAGLDVLVVPSMWYENTPLVIYSALAAKLPVVASDFPGISEVVRHDVNGLLFEPGSDRALSAQLLRLTGEPELLASLSNRCLRPKSTSEYVDELMRLFSDPGVAARRAPGARPRQTMEPLDRDSGGFLAGWVVAGFRAPALVQLQIGERVVAKTRVLSPRADVRDALRKQGRRVDHVNFGFRLVFPAEVDRAGVVLRVVGQDQRVIEIPLVRLLRGAAVDLGAGDLACLDEERFRPAPARAGSGRAEEDEDSRASNSYGAAPLS